MDHNDDDARAVAEKLVALDLSEGERSALDAVFARTSEAEVEGFAHRPRIDRYFEVLRPPGPRRYIGETEKNLRVFEGNDEP